MTRIEFIDILQKTLTGSLPSSLVNENVNYYQDYIDMQTRTGQTEEEVIEALGDPRLLAKTIVEAAKHEGQGGERADRDEIYEEGMDGEPRQDNGKKHRISGWVMTLVIILIIVAVISIVGSVVSMLLPFIIPIACIVLLMRFFQNRNR